MKILGFDISSSTIGWSILSFEKDDKKIDLIDYGFIKPPAKETGGLSYRLYETTTLISALLSDKNPDIIIVEDYARKYQAGKSSANIITLLTAFNETVCLSSYSYNKAEPIRIPVTSIRSLLGQHVGEKTVSKDDVFSIIESNFGKNQTLNFVPTKNKKNNTKKEFFDISDSIAVALAYIKRDLI